jgi:hypothetical protein
VVFRIRGWLIAILALAALCAPVAHAATKKVATKVLSGGGQADAGKDAGFSQRCPKAFPHPVGTEFNGGSDNLALQEAFAFGGGHRSWDQAVHNFGAAQEPFVSGAICLRARGRFAYPLKSGTVPPGGSATQTITCPRRAPRALNGTLAPATDADVGKIVMAGSIRGTGSRRWVVAVRNLGAAPQSFLAGAVCTSAKLRIVSRSTSPFTVAPGQSDGAAGRCPKRARHPVAATFYPVDDSGAGQFTLGAAGEDNPGSLSTVVTNRGQSPERVVVGEVCVG